MKKWSIFIIIAVILIAILDFLFFPWHKETKEESSILTVNSFEECAAKGYPVMLSYPAKCIAPDGKTFTEDIGNELEKTDIIVISTPRPNELIKSPIKISGEARGTWFFEASFPIKLLDGNGKELGAAVAQAKSDWMTTEFVPFEATLEFPTPSMKKGTLILEKDNPSDLPQNADQLIIPIRFQ
jgi:hypothetical protein